MPPVEARESSWALISFWNISAQKRHSTMIVRKIKSHWFLIFETISMCHDLNVSSNISVLFRHADSVL